jgi:GntR family transcriptional regulator
MRDSLLGRAVPLEITLNSNEPIYLQIVKAVRQHVASGKLQPEEELPPIRVLANQLVVNSHTVAHAYRELEQEGVLIKRSTKGTFVSENVHSATARGQRVQKLARTADTLLHEARELDIALEEVIALLRERVAAHRSQD